MRTPKRLRILELLALLIVFALCGGAMSALAQSPQIFGGKVPQAGQSLSGIVWPRARVVFLTDGNKLLVRDACDFGPLRKLSITGVAGQVINVDYRVADGLLYALDDLGRIYTLEDSGAATLVSSLTVPFGGDIRSLADFNPVANALRLIGANDQNYAVVGAGLNVTVPQTTLAYAQGDLNAGRNPNVVGGAYTNNFAGAATTLFYGVDYDLDTLVGIAGLVNGSSATGGGRLQTIARLPFDVDKTADVDIYTDAQGRNSLIGVSGRTLFTIDLGQINQALPLGQLQTLRVRAIPILNENFIDVAVGPRSCDQ